MTTPIPVTGITPIYDLEYLVEGEPLFHTRAKLERNAKTIEAALQSRGVAAPGAADLLTVSGRVSVAEGEIDVLQAPPGRKVTKTSVQAIPAGQWTALTWVDLAGSTSGPGMWAGTAPSRLTSTKAGRWRGMVCTIGPERLQIRSYAAGAADVTANGGVMLNANPGSTLTNASCVFDEAVIPVGGFIQAFAWNPSALDTNTGPGTRNGYTSYFSMTYVGA